MRTSGPNVSLAAARAGYESAPNSPVTRDEDAVVLRRIFEQLVVIGSLGEAVHRSLDVPTFLMKAVNELLADVGVREEWKPSH